PNYLQHLSYFSMGCDVNDFNNDAWPDIFTVDMLPEDNKRQKLLYGPDNYEQFALMVMSGFYFQNMRNMLHLNNGDGTYSEIGQLAGISQTDWSWAPLFADYDNDGWKDLFVTNGYYRDYTNRDFLKYKGDYYFERAKAKEKADTFHLVSTMTSTPVHNYIFRNNGDLTFTNKSEEWGFSNADFSNGAAYADLDNDGDLDLIVNNENATASVFKNHTRERHPDRSYLQIVLKGRGKNANAIGAKVSVYHKGKVQYFEQMSTRGFQSSVTNRMHIGLKDVDKADSIRIDWLSGARTILRDVPANQLIKITQPEESTVIQAESSATGRTIFSKAKPRIHYTHAEQGFNDFKRQPLLLTMLTPCGPVMDTADVNADGRTDVFVGGTEGNPAAIFFQAEGGRFLSAGADAFASHRKFTDADARFFDADGDRDMDLYVVSGGYNDYTENDKALQDRLYLNDGKGRFTLATDALPEMFTSKACVVTGDFDQDGDDDLFVGGRVIPGKYPVTPESFLLQNNGGRFEKVTDSRAPGLSRIGMVTDAAWTDVNKDGWKDLVVVGEYMSVEVFINEKGAKLRRASDQFLDKPLHGLWNRMLVHDFDKDGDDDIIIGNIGLNTQLRASESEPVTLVYKDFDHNGSVDPIMNHYIQGKSYPFPNRDELLDQMYSMRSRYTSYAAYADAQLHTIFSGSELKDAQTLKATILESVYLENKNGRYVMHPLPAQAQFSPVYAMTLTDYNKDGNMDVILAGNQSSIRIRMGVIDANFGQLLQGDGKGNFTYVPQSTSGLSITGDVKSLQMMEAAGEHHLLIGINNVGIESYKLN
ncbi:MAG TPA: VCBS repeat-containing protein, partial [Ohtaekwangia sp.]|nr:VCBS repeat-containing protein [Ohtaekwangia sp.]